MKVRNGFVSNSSSSSFVMAFSERVHDELLKELDAIQRRIMDVMCAGPHNFLGNKVYVYSYSTDHGGNGHHDYELERVLRNGDAEESDDEDNNEEYDFDEDENKYSSFSYNLDGMIKKKAAELGEEVLIDEWDM